MEHFNPNAPLSAVDPADVEALWRFMLKANPGFADPIAVAPGAQACAPNIGIDISLVARHCSDGADVYAVFFRTSLLGMLLRTGALSPWQREGELDAVVFEVAATLPISSLKGFAPDAFLAQVRKATDLH